MSIKGVGVSDLHAGNTRAGSFDKKARMNSTWEVMNRSLTQAVDLANDSGADFFYMPGDVFENGRPPAHAVHLVVQQLQRLKCKRVIIANGNHDQTNVVLNHATPVDAYLASHDWCLAAASEPTVVDVDGLQVGIMPWCRVAGSSMVEQESLHLKAQVEKMADRLSKGNDPSFFFGHVMLEEIVFNPALQGVEAKLAPGALSADVPVKMLENGPWVAARLGHIHKRQDVSENVGYVGSPYKVDFGEAHEAKGAELIEIHEDGTYDLTFHQFETRQLMALDISETLEPLLDVAPTLKKGDQLRLTVPGRSVEAAALSKKINSQIKDLRLLGVNVELMVNPVKQTVDIKKPLSPNLGPKKSMAQHIDEQTNWTAQKKKRANELFADILSRSE